MIVTKVVCDICDRTIVYEGTTLISGVKVKLAQRHKVHICKFCKEEIKKRVLNEEKK